MKRKEKKRRNFSETIQTFRTTTARISCFFTRKKICCIAAANLLRALFSPASNRERKKKRGTVTRLYICIWKTRRKNTISLAIKNLVINKLIPLLSRARDFVCQLGMYKRNVAARNRCGLTAQLHSLSSSRWILFLVNELRSWISPYTFHFRGRYISLLHLVHPFPMKIIEQFRVNQTSISQTIERLEKKGDGFLLHSLINARGKDRKCISDRIVIFFNRRVNHGEITPNDECEFVGRSIGTLGRREEGLFA